MRYEQDRLPNSMKLWLEKLLEINQDEKQRLFSEVPN